MFQRKYLQILKKWSLKKDRKPLVLRGARQVGKTTLVNIFSKEFKQYIYLNLEAKEQSALFKTENDFETIVEGIFFRAKKRRNIQTLIFIDEIQNSPEAVALLRYFYEKTPDIYLIAAGSLLETLIEKKISFPVGRVEFLPIKPFSYEEFLIALNEHTFVEIMGKIPLPDYAVSELLQLFRRYTLLGGMPEVVKKYVQTKSIIEANEVFESLITSYLDDVEKYAKSDKKIQIIRHIIKNSFVEAGNRIRFAGFGSSNYKSQDIADAFHLLEKTFLLKLIYPTGSTKIPVQPDYKKSPKLQLLDTGLVNYFAGLQDEVFGSNELSEAYGGKIAEHIVYQELIAQNNSLLHEYHFWVREKKQSNAEVDIVFPYKNLLIPIEIKSGATGRLRSLHQFIDRCPHQYAVRFYSEKVKIDKLKTLQGKSFYLLNLPYFLVSKLNEYIEWFMKQTDKN